MNAFSGLNGGINSGDKFTDIKNQHRDNIADVFTANSFWSEHDGNCPPEPKTIYKKYRELRQQGLCTMPSYKISAFAVADKKDERSNQINDRQRHPCN